MPHRAAVELLTPVVHHFASAHGIRVLSIKGDVLAAQGLRARRRPSDVDILVDPARFTDLTRLLGEAGWMDRDKKVLVALPRAGSALAPHARTLENVEWPCQLDLHRYYPGFLRPAHDVFDALWEARDTTPIAHVRCAVPAPLDHWLLAALHTLRSGDGAQLQELEASASRLFAQRQNEVVARAIELGAVGPLRDSLARLTGTRPDVPESDRPLLADWARRLDDPGNSPDAFLEQFRGARGRARLALVLRYAWPAPRSARAFHDVKAGPWGLARFYAVRLALAPVKLADILRRARSPQSESDR